MNRSVLAGVAVLLTGGFIALYFLVIKAPPAAKSETPVATGSGTTTTGPTGIGPALPNSAGNPQLPQGHESTTTDRDTTGMVLTDHRGSGSGTIVLDGTEGSGAPVRALDPGLVRTIHRNAQTIVLGCAAKVPVADRGPRPRIGVALKVAIKDHELTVIGVTPELEDLGGDQAKAAEDCVRSLMMNFSAPTPDEADIDSHVLRYQYVVK